MPKKSAFWGGGDFRKASEGFFPMGVEEGHHRKDQKVCGNMVRISFEDVGLCFGGKTVCLDYFWYEE